MDSNDEKETGELVPSTARSLALRPSALVARGIRELCLRSYWSTRQVFTKQQMFCGLSAKGQVCTYSNFPPELGHRLEIHNIEQDSEPFSLSIPSGPMREGLDFDSLAADLMLDWQVGWESRVGWSACGRYLAIPLAAPDSALLIVDLNQRQVLYKRDLFSGDPEGDKVRLPRKEHTHIGDLAWSGDGKYLAAASAGYSWAPLRLLESSANVATHKFEQKRGLKVIERDGFIDFYGPFIGAAFSPNGEILATFVEGDVFLLDVPTLEIRKRLNGSYGPEISWTQDGRSVICNDVDEGDQVYRIDVETNVSTPLPFRADIIRCNPKNDLCAFYPCEFLDADGAPIQDPTKSLESIAHGLLIADLENSSHIAEWNSIEVMDMQWSPDGTKLYVISRQGRGYVYILPKG